MSRFNRSIRILSTEYQVVHGSGGSSFAASIGIAAGGGCRRGRVGGRSSELDETPLSYQISAAGYVFAGPAG
ncbi:hypothetical protein [Nocardia sp. NBC_01327]|uniref:hypothetical protein n=1 Tax=Nocardia sp. NBC_01327 TaxID=2903593 RepID=UPI002E12A8B9|nr:hypothetical protein OG326_42065 [Nocardia sp. NBC_01327]